MRNAIVEPFKELRQIMGDRQLAGDLGVNEGFLDEVCADRFKMNASIFLILFRVVEEDDRVPNELKQKFRDLRETDTQDLTGHVLAKEFQASTLGQFEDLSKLQKLWCVLRSLPADRRQEIIAEALDSTMPKSNIIRDAP